MWSLSAPLFSIYIYIYIVKSLYFLIRNFKPLSIIFCGCIAQFVSSLVRNHGARFSLDEAHKRQKRARSSDHLHQEAAIVIQLFSYHSELLENCVRVPTLLGENKYDT